MTLQDKVIKGPGNFMEGNSFFYIPTPPKLITIDIVDVEKILMNV